jgi:hypothetical protein
VFPVIATPQIVPSMLDATAYLDMSDTRLDVGVRIDHWFVCCAEREEFSKGRIGTRGELH